jgi:hypothetical protein
MACRGSPHLARPPALKGTPFLVTVLVTVNHRPVSQLVTMNKAIVNPGVRIASLHRFL